MNILALGAHFDDIELGCGGSLLRWGSQGDRVTLFVACSSGYRDAHGQLVRSDEQAHREGVRAAQRLGAELIEGSFPVFEIEFGEALNRALVEMIERVEPDLVLTHWQEDVHHDHVALARSVFHCCKHVPRLLTYRSNWYGGGREFAARFSVDISEHMEAKVELVQIFESENGRTEGRWVDFVRSQARLLGLKAGVEYAEAFEVVKWLL